MFTQKNIDNIDEKCDKIKVLTSLHKIIERQVDSCDAYPLNIYEVRNYCYYGLLQKSLRPKCWKLFLGYFSKNKFKHEKFLREQRKNYIEFCEKAIVENNNNSGMSDVINDDVDRTFIDPAYTTKDGVKRKTCKFLDSGSSLLNAKCSNRDVIKRLLLTFKLTNTSVSYVQGMASLLIPIYYVFKNDAIYNEREYAEPDSYYCFFNLMAEIGNNFVKSMDSDQNLGINNQMKTVFEIVRYMEPKLYQNLQEKRVFDFPFHFKWVALNMAQEYKIDGCIWLWDRFLADNKRFEIVLFCCAATIIHFKEFLMKSSYEECMELLQKNNKTDPEVIFEKADLLRRDYNAKKNANKQ